MWPDTPVRPAEALSRVSGTAVRHGGWAGRPGTVVTCVSSKRGLLTFPAGFLLERRGGEPSVLMLFELDRLSQDYGRRLPGLTFSGLLPRFCFSGRDLSRSFGALPGF